MSYAPVGLCCVDQFSLSVNNKNKSNTISTIPNNNNNNNNKNNKHHHPSPHNPIYSCHNYHHYQQQQVVYYLWYGFDLVFGPRISGLVMNLIMKRTSLSSIYSFLLIYWDHIEWLVHFGPKTSSASGNKTVKMAQCRNVSVCLRVRFFSFLSKSFLTGTQIPS